MMREDCGTTFCWFGWFGTLLTVQALTLVRESVRLVSEWRRVAQWRSNCARSDPSPSCAERRRRRRAVAMQFPSHHRREEATRRCPPVDLFLAARRRAATGADAPGASGLGDQSSWCACLQRQELAQSTLVSKPFIAVKLRLVTTMKLALDPNRVGGIAVDHMSKRGSERHGTADTLDSSRQVAGVSNFDKGLAAHEVDARSWSRRLNGFDNRWTLVLAGKTPDLALQVPGSYIQGSSDRHACT
jgi:hypothetical protein